MISKKTVAVTGGSGFIGIKVIEELLKNGHRVISLQRSSQPLLEIEWRYFDLSNSDSINKDLLFEVDIVIHAAALVHDASASYELQDSCNFQATKNLFNLCVEEEIEKFIFLSSVAVYGLSSSSEIINVKSNTAPISAYGKAKLNSENFLLSSEVSTEISILRLPLVYGKGAPGNFGTLEKIAASKIPLPFLNINNKRSMVSVFRLAEIIVSAVEFKDRYLGLQLLCEGQPFSTKELIKKLRVENGMTSLLFPFPKQVLKFVFTAFGKEKIYEQLFEDLEFESTI